MVKVVRNHDKPRLMGVAPSTFQGGIPLFIMIFYHGGPGNIIEEMLDIKSSLVTRWWLNQPIFKNMSQIGFIFPQFSG